MEQHSAIKRNEALTHATAKMDLENIMLSARSRNKGHTLYDSTFRKIPHLDTSIEAEGRFIVSRVWKDEEWDSRLKRVWGFSENVLEPGNSDDCTTL